jgi:CBS domain containing-hemolysin-like protein
MTSVLALLTTLLLVLLNGFFVAAEFAIIKVRPTRLEQLYKAGDARARLALDITHRLDAYLSATQLGVTLASLGLGWIGEPELARLVEPAFASLGAWAVPASHVVGVVVAFMIITATHTIVGELAPKSFAIQHTEEITLWAARPLWIFYHLAWPAIRALNAGANGFIRIFGIQPARKEELRYSSEELRMALAKSPAGLDPALRSMLVRIFDQRRRTARHVMTLRTDIASIRGRATVDEGVRFAVESGYSRYPVLDERGTVLGYLHLRDLFEVLAGRRKATRVVELLRKPIFAREDASVERLRLEMQARQVPMAVITSGSGELVGLVTMEDLLEEIVGEIRDETDEEVAPIHQRGGGIVDVDGRVLVADLERDASIVLKPEEKVETVGGYVLARLGHPADTGERVECEGLTLIVTDVVGRRVRRVRIVPMSDPSSVPPGEPGADPGVEPG